jgi:prolyl-tRNA editing enzyme YbaK/EbsC (Cys-tRNA(Pro) deacylase)
VYNLSGAKVMTLKGMDLGEGANTIVLDRGNLENGVYIVVLKVDGQLITKKVSLVR